MKKDSNFYEMLVDISSINEQLDLIASEIDKLSDEVGSLDPTEYTGYDATKTQTLKNIEGTLTWVTDEE